MPPIRRKRILVIEQDDTLRRAVCETLQSIGFNTVSENNGHSGLSRITLERKGPQPIEGVLMSLTLSIYPSLSVLSELRMNYPALPVIVMATHRAEHLIPDALRVGAQDSVLVPKELELFKTRCSDFFNKPPPTEI